MEKQDNYFITLSQVKCETEKKNNLTYVSWADAWAEIKKIHPDATYTIYENQEGQAFFESKFGIDCKVGVTINSIEHIVRLPVMDGANNAMKYEKQEFEKEKYVYSNGKKVWDNENNCRKKEKYTQVIESATQFDINKTIQRAFAKAIAMHGVGLYVYRGEDLPEEPEVVKPKFTEERFKKFKETEKYKDKFDAFTQLEKLYELDIPMRKKIKEYYESKGGELNITQPF